MINSVFSDFAKKTEAPYKGNYLHAGVDLPTSGNTGFDLDGEPTLSGYLDQFQSDDGQWCEEFVPCRYTLSVKARVCGDAVSGLYSEISKAKLEECVDFGTYPDCTLLIPESHQWDDCLRDKFNLPKDGVAIHLVVKGYKVINRPDLMPKGVIVAEAVYEAIKLIESCDGEEN